MILILCTTRSGSSLVTAIFAAHGLNFGQDAMTAGYRSFEDQAVKAHLRPMSNGPFEWATDAGGTADLIRERGIDVFKCGLEYWPAFEGMDSLHVVKVKRNPASVAASLAEKKGLPIEQCLEAVKHRYAMLDTIPGVEVDTDALVGGDFGGIWLAFSRCGLDLDIGKARKVIRPDMWRH